MDMSRSENGHEPVESGVSMIEQKHKHRKKHHRRKGSHRTSHEQQVIVETTRIVAQPEVLDQLANLFVDSSGKPDILSLRESVLRLQPGEQKTEGEVTPRRHRRTRHRTRHHKHGSRSNDGAKLEEESVIENEYVVPVPQALKRDTPYSLYTTGDHGKGHDAKQADTDSKQFERKKGLQKSKSAPPIPSRTYKNIINKKKMQELPQRSEVEHNTEDTQSAEVLLSSNPIYAAPWEMPRLRSSSMTKKRNEELISLAKSISQSKDIWLAENKYLVNPPPRDFKFSLPLAMPHAIRGMDLDPKLMEARFELIPNILNEKDFWATYFWHIELGKMSILEKYKESPLAEEQDKIVYCRIGESSHVKKALERELSKLKRKSIDPQFYNLLRENGLDSILEYFLEHDVYTIEDALNMNDDSLIDIGFKTEKNRKLFRSLLSSSRGHIEESLDMVEMENIVIDEDFKKLLRELNCESFSQGFLNLGICTIFEASGLSDEKLREVGITSENKIKEFKEAVRESSNSQQDISREEPEAESDEDRMKGELSSPLMELLKDFGFESLINDFIGLKAFTLEKAYELPDEEYMKIGFNSPAKIVKFKDALKSRINREESSSAEVLQTELDMSFQELLEEYGFEFLEEDFVRLKVYSFEDAFNLEDEEYVKLGFNKKEKIEKFKKSLKWAIEESSSLQAKTLKKDLKELLQHYGFEALESDFEKHGVYDLKSALELSDDLYVEMGFDTLEKIARFKNSIKKFIAANEEEDDTNEENDKDDYGSCANTISKELHKLLEDFDLLQFHEKFIKNRLVTLNDVSQSNIDNFLNIGFASEDMARKLIEEAKRRNEKEKVTKNTSVAVPEKEQPSEYAAPWELPPLKSEELTKFQEELLNMRALNLSKNRHIWTTVDTSKKLKNPPPRVFKFSLPMVLPHANVAMEKDPELRKARFELIPKQLEERDFWSKYFWEIELLKIQVKEEVEKEASGSEDLEISTQLKKIYCPLARPPIIHKALQSEYCNRKESEDFPWLKQLVPGGKDESDDFRLHDDLENTVDKQIESSEQSDATFEAPNDSSEEEDEEIVAKEYAAPWEMPPLGTPEINAKRDNLVKERVYELSRTRNIWELDDDGKLLRPPPRDFKFSVHMAMPHINVALEKDENLRNARFEMVPKSLSEREFWSAYFWEVEQIKLQVTDEIQTAEHDELLAERTFSHIEPIQEQNKIYESVTSSPMIRGVVVREHVRRKLSQHNSNDSNLLELSEDQDTADLDSDSIASRKLLKRVSFSFDQAPDELTGGEQEAKLSPSQADSTEILNKNEKQNFTKSQVEATAESVEDVQLSMPHREVDQNGVELLEANFPGEHVSLAEANAGSKEFNKQTYSSEPDKEAETGESESDSIELLLETRRGDQEADDDDAIEDDLLVIRKSSFKIVKFFVPPVLLIPLMIILRFWFTLLVVVQDFCVFLSRRIIAALRRTLWYLFMFHLIAIRIAVKLLRKVVKRILGLGRRIGEWASRNVLALVRFHRAVVKRTVRGIALILARIRKHAKSIIVALISFSLQPVHHISHLVKQILSFPVRVGRAVVGRSKTTAKYIEKNKDDTLDITVALISLAVIFLTFSGVLFPFIHDSLVSIRYGKLHCLYFDLPFVGRSLCLPTIAVEENKSLIRGIWRYFY